MLTEAQIRRYGRHVLLPELGGRGQARLCAGTACVRGEGLASETALLYLVAAGVGRVSVEEGLRSEVVGHARGVEPACVIRSRSRSEHEHEHEHGVGLADGSVLGGPGEEVAEGARAALRALLAIAEVARS